MSDYWRVIVNYFVCNVFLTAFMTVIFFYKISVLVLLVIQFIFRLEYLFLYMKAKIHSFEIVICLRRKIKSSAEHEVWSRIIHIIRDITMEYFTFSHSFFLQVRNEFQ